MALSMPGPFQHHTGVFFLNVRVPIDLLPRVRGAKVSLPVEDELVTLSVGQKVFLSLKTKDPDLARQRFAVSYAALVRHWQALRNGPKALTHKQLFALAAEAYHRSVARFESDPDHGPHVVAKADAMEREAMNEWRYGEPGDDELDESSARFFTAIQRPYGPQLLAVELGRDLDTPYCKVTHAEALEDLFGTEADRICAERALILDPSTRAKLLFEIAVAMNFVGQRMKANAKRDYSVDHSERFPAFVEPVVTPPKPIGSPQTTSIASQIESFMAHNADKKAPATLRRYTPSLNSFAVFHKNKDIRLVTDEDVLAWAEHRRDVDAIAVSTINGNDIVAVKSLFSFISAPMRRKKLRIDNPARGIKLDLPRRDENLDKKFSEREIGEILALARRVTPRKNYPRASACRRWSPWICAYTGARIQEVCSLTKKDIRQRDGLYAFHFPKTKEGISRWVIVHSALIEEGLLDFWGAAPDGALFTGDKPQRPNASRSAAEYRAGEMAAWISKNVDLDDGVSPNHAWRHTFITAAREAKFDPPEIIDVITGHNRKKNASAGYYSPSPKAMSTELAKYPRYKIKDDP